MKKLNITFEENGRKLRLVRDSYANNNATYFGLIDDETGEPFCDITVNLHFSSKTIIELDNDFRNYTSKGLIKSVSKELTDCYLTEDYSGYCSYPVLKLKEKYIE